MPPLTSKESEEDLSRLERDIRQLKIEYEQYFGGGKKRPPAEIEWRIEQVIKRYGDRGAEMNYGQRFRYSNLAQTYVKYRDIFHKRLMKREEGRVDRHFGKAARDIEAARSYKQPALPPPLPVATSVSVSCSDPEQEPRKVEEIYIALRQAMEGAGEPAAKLSREQFERFLRQKMEQIRKQQGGKNVEFVVSVENGKARLKARVQS